jgi:hypothetical protein
MSIIQSHAVMTSMSCSTTSTVLPLSTRVCSCAKSRHSPPVLCSADDLRPLWESSSLRAAGSLQLSMMNNLMCVSPSNCTRLVFPVQTIRDIFLNDEQFSLTWPDSAHIPLETRDGTFSSVLA